MSPERGWSLVRFEDGGFRMTLPDGSVFEDRPVETTSEVDDRDRQD